MNNLHVTVGKLQNGYAATSQFLGTSYEAVYNSVRQHVIRIHGHLSPEKHKEMVKAYMAAIAIFAVCTAEGAKEALTSDVSWKGSAGILGLYMFMTIILCVGVAKILAYENARIIKKSE